MVKGRFLDDTFEKLIEHGSTAVKQGGKSVAQIVSPTRIIEQLTGQYLTPDKSIEQIEKAGSKKQNHTPLDFQKLHCKYQDQEKVKMETLRNRLFQLVKSGEEKVIHEKKKEKEEEKRKIFYEHEEKKKKLAEKQKQEQTAGIPKGKIRHSIFSPKKVAERQQTEFKPSSGKQ